MRLIAALLLLVPRTIGGALVFLLASLAKSLSSTVVAPLD